MCRRPLQDGDKSVTIDVGFRWLQLTTRPFLLYFFFISATAIMFLLSPSSSEGSHDTFSLPFNYDEAWKVTGGYNTDPCHLRRSPCGGDEYYAFDLVPDAGNAGGRDVLAPAAGTLIQRFSLATDCSHGEFVKIRLDGDGFILHLYHLMNVSKSPGQRYSQNEFVGKVYDANPCGNHLHIQVSNPSGASQPLTFNGVTYHDKGGANQWVGTRLVRRSDVCPAPNLIEPSEGAVSSSRTITFRWNAVSGCTFNGYTFRVKTNTNMDDLATGKVVDTGVGGTQHSETITGYDNIDLYWVSRLPMLLLGPVGLYGAFASSQVAALVLVLLVLSPLAMGKRSIIVA